MTGTLLSDLTGIEMKRKNNIVAKTKRSCSIALCNWICGSQDAKLDFF